MNATPKPQPASPSPLVTRVLDKKRRLHESKSKWKWAAVNAAAAAVVFVDAHRHNFVLNEDSGWRTALSAAESVLILVLVTNAVVDLVNHFFPFLSISDVVNGSKDSTDVVLTKKQMDLFDVPEGTPGFRLREEKKTDSGSRGHPFGFSPPLDGSFISSASLDSTSGWQFYREPPPPASPVLLQDGVQKFTSRLQGEVVADPKSLSRLINEYEMWERSRNSDLDASNSSMTNVNQTATSGTDCSPYLRKMNYQASSPMPESNPDPVMDKSRQSPARKASKAEVSMCVRLGVTGVELVSVMENLRMWISQTVLRRVTEEIQKTNDLLVKQGMSDERIGLVGVEKLKKVALMPNILHHVASLDSLIPFLDFHPNQEYLVQRYRELSAGGAMSEFKWNSGGRFKGQEWNDKLPTDSEIVITSFASYLDSRLPSNFVSGKPFTDVYFVRSASGNARKEDGVSEAKVGLSGLSPGLQTLVNLQRGTGSSVPEDTRKVEETDKELCARGCVIVQTSQKPPQFEVHLKKDGAKVEKITVEVGRNNLFYTILLFLHHIKTRESGTLERINFGSSGVNLLWVIGGKD